MILENEFLQKWDEFVNTAAPNKEQNLYNLRSLVCKSLSNFTDTLDLSLLESKIKFSNMMTTSIIALQKAIADLQYVIDEEKEQTSTELIEVVLPTVYSDASEQNTLCDNITANISTKLSSKENIVLKAVIYSYTENGYNLEIILA